MLLYSERLHVFVIQFQINSIQVHFNSAFIILALDAFCFKAASQKMIHFSVIRNDSVINKSPYSVRFRLFMMSFSPFSVHAGRLSSSKMRNIVQVCL